MITDDQPEVPLFSQMNAEQWREFGHYFTHHQYDIFYLDTQHQLRTSKQLPTIVCLHGFPTNSWDWRKILDELSLHYHVIAPDLLGFGFSDKPLRHQYNIHEQANLVEALLEYLGIKDYHLLAHGYGDTVAQELIMRCNQNTHLQAKVLSCCFLNGCLIPEAHRPDGLQRILSSPFGGIAKYFLNGPLMKRRLRHLFYDQNSISKKELDITWSILSLQNGHLALKKLMHYTSERQAFRKRWLDALVHGNTPMMLIFGAQDSIAGKEMISRYLEQVGQGNIVSLDEVGHYPQLEAPQKVLTYYLGFLEGFSLVANTAS